MADLTPSQTIGPYFEVALPRPGHRVLVTSGTPGRRIRIEGVVFDGARTPVPDALIETWQADARGRYDHPDGPESDPAQTFGRIPVGDRGDFSIDTVVPGPVPGPGGAMQAPHLLVGIFARGLLGRLVTRIYFPDAGALDQDPILSLVPAERRPTLIADRIEPDRYRFDIVLQGPDETVFFDV